MRGAEGGRPRIAVVSKLLPAPTTTGARQRSYAMLREFARVGEVTLYAPQLPGDDPAAVRALGVEVRSVTADRQPARLLRGVARTGSLTAARCYYPQLHRMLRAEPAPDLLVADFSQSACYLRGVGARTRLLATHNVEHLLMARSARLAGPAGRVLLGAEAAALRRLERRALSAADVVSVVSDTDRSRLAALGPAERVLVAPNGWDPSPLLAVTDEPVVAFIALLSWRPNVDAARWLAGQVWPLVRARVPAARLLLIGADPAPAVQALAGGGVEVVGPVPDVRPWLARTAVATAPLRAGGGTRLKILEALDAGRPVVATTVGAEGLTDLVGHGVVLADQPGAFAAELVALLGDPARRRALGRAGHAAIAAGYDWTQTLRPLVDLLGPLAPLGPAADSVAT